jgi:hypothetical protein
VQASRTDHIDPATKRCPQIHDQLTVVHETSTSVEIDHQIDVAIVLASPWATEPNTRTLRAP